nr:type II toxin-antitoxin system RelB/DinJ family antitoxin [uncultured Oscillibacter sp.]
MSMDATLQIRIDGELKAQVEELYRGLGTSFAEAVRIFARQSLREGGMPFRPALKTWDELTREEINAKLVQSEADIAAGYVCAQEELDSRMKERFANGRNTAV